MTSSSRCESSFEPSEPSLEEPAEVDVREVGIGPALRRGDPDLGRGRVVVELDEEALEELSRTLAGQGAVGEAPLVEGAQVLVEVAGVEGVPAVELGDDREVAEPVRLERLVEVAGSVCGDPGTGLGDLAQLGAARGVRLRGGGGTGLTRVARGEEQDCVAGDVHGQELLALRPGLGVLRVVEGREGGRDVGLGVEEAAPVDLVVEDRVPRRPLLHELGEEAGLVEGVPLRGQRGEEPVAEGAAAPVGDHLPLVGLDHVGGHGVARLRARVEDPQVLHAVTGELRERGHRLRGGAALADDQFAVAQVDLLLLAEVEEGAGPHHRDGPAAVVLAVEAGEEDGPLGRDRGSGVEAQAAQGFGPGVHGLSLRSARRGRGRGRARRGSRVARAVAGRGRRARTRVRGGGPWAPRSGGRGAG